MSYCQFIKQIPKKSLERKTETEHIFFVLQFVIK